MVVSKAVKKMRFYESTLLSAYKVRRGTSCSLIWSVDADLNFGLQLWYPCFEVFPCGRMQAYLQRLMALKQKASFQRVAIRCICTLLDAVPHFNFRESLLAAVIHNISSPDDVVRF